ncbi:unnamed protein product, partial [Rotaria magnacalcarata]
IISTTTNGEAAFVRITEKVLARILLTTNLGLSTTNFAEKESREKFFQIIHVQMDIDPSSPTIELYRTFRLENRYSNEDKCQTDMEVNRYDIYFRSR